MAHNIPKFPLLVNAIKNMNSTKILQTSSIQFENNTDFLNMLLTINGSFSFAESITPNPNNNQSDTSQLVQPIPQQFSTNPFCLFTLADQLLPLAADDIGQQLESVFTIKERLWPQPKISYQDRKNIIHTIAKTTVKQSDVGIHNLMIQEITAGLHHNYNITMPQSQCTVLNEDDVAYINPEKQLTKQQNQNNPLIIPYYQLLDIVNITIDPTKICYKYEITEEYFTELANNQITTYITSVKNKNGQVEKITVQLKPVHLGTVEIVFTPDQYMNNIQINVEKESTYFMLKHNSHQLILMLDSVGLKQSQINLNFTLQDRKTDRKWNNDLTHSESNIELLESGLDKNIKAANMWCRALVRSVSWLI